MPSVTKSMTSSSAGGPMLLLFFVLLSVLWSVRGVREPEGRRIQAVLIALFSDTS